MDAQLLDRYADLIVSVGANVQPDQVLAVEALPEAQPLVAAIARRAYEKGARYVDVQYFDGDVKRIRAESALDDFFAKQTSQTPAIDFTARDGVRHSSWIISRESDIDFIQKAFLEIRQLYIADGHHRCAAAARVYQSRKGAGNSRYFLSVIFPHNQVQNLAYGGPLLLRVRRLAATCLPAGYGSQVPAAGENGGARSGCQSRGPHNENKILASAALTVNNSSGRSPTGDPPLCGTR